MFTEEKIIIYCSQDEVKAFARGEIFADKIIGKKAFEFEYTDFEIRCEKPYKMTYDDFCYALKKFYKSYVGPGDFMYRWLEPLLSCFVDAVGLVNLIGEKNITFVYDDYCGTAKKLSQKDEDICMNIIIDLYFLERYISDDMDPDVLNKGLEELVNQLENQKYNRNHSLLNCRFTDQQLRDFVYSNPDGVNVQRLNEEECKIYKSALEKLYKMEEIEAIEIMGYACYGYDHPIFQCDWEKSRDSMLKLIKRADDETKARAANTLGYIYYYGRCNNYEPQYEEAFKYFSIAAFFGIYEAIYKVGDMMLHGKGIPKNETAALNLYHNIYEEIFDDFQRQNYKNNLADIALRLAGACKKKEKYLSAFYYYLIANLAIEMRMRETKFFGDRKVFDSIENGLEEVRLQLYSNGLDVRNRYDMVYIESVLSQIFYYKDDKCLVKLDIKIYGDEIRLRFGRVEVENSLYPMRLVVCVPEIAYRDLTDRVYLSVDKEDVFIYDAFEKNNGIINRYEVYRGGINLYLNDELVLFINNNQAMFGHGVIF